MTIKSNSLPMVLAYNFIIFKNFLTMKKFFVPFVAGILLGAISSSAQSTTPSSKSQPKRITATKPKPQPSTAPQPALATRSVTTKAASGKSGAAANAKASISNTEKPKKAHHLQHRKNTAQSSAGAPDQTAKKSKLNPK